MGIDGGTLTLKHHKWVWIQIQLQYSTDTGRRQGKFVKYK